jgi:hypothetical protein
MLAVFSLRLATGMLACLLLLPQAHPQRGVGTASLGPRFYRTHFLTALGLACLALLLVRDMASWPVLLTLGGATALTFAGSLAWSLEGAPAGRALIVLSTASLGTGLGLLEASTPHTQPLGLLLLGSLTASAVLGTALTAMLVGHSYLIATSMSMTPLLRLLAALALAVLARMAVDGFALGCWTAQHSLAKLTEDGTILLWLPLRWGLGFVGPLVLTWMAWQTARIRSTQSATGILYVVVIFCFLGELTSQLLRDTRITL